MKNLKNETIEFINSIGKKDEPIEFIGIIQEGKRKSCCWVDFLELSDFDYDDGYGLQEISDICIIFDDNSWMSRWEYDGSEGWQHNQCPQFKENEYNGELTREDIIERWP